MQGQTRQIDHLSICAQMIDSVEMCEKIDHILPTSRANVPMGKRVASMVLNGLGFVNRALSLSPSFLKKRPVDLLLGECFVAEDFNDDALGRCLDAIHEFGEDKFFSTIALDIASREGLIGPVSRLDSTSFKVFGDYQVPMDVPDDQVLITQGYSKDHRPDLNQVMMTLITNGGSDFPVMMIPQSGNTSDKTEFERVIKARTKELQERFNIPEMTWYADSALYGKAWIETQKKLSVKWVTRMPNTVKLCKTAKEKARRTPLGDWAKGEDGYHFFDTEGTYADVTQRVIVVHSQALFKTHEKTHKKKLAKKLEQAEKILRKLEALEFSCEEDAMRAIQMQNKSFSHHNLELVEITKISHFFSKGRPAKGKLPDKETFRVSLALSTSLEKVSSDRREHGLFVLASNNMNKEEFSAKEALAGYKGLGANERHFRFLKDPHFFADSFYVKKPGRLSALLCVMTLSLLIYHLCELKVRAAVKRDDLVVKNLDNRRVKNPTAKLIFQHFVGTSQILVMNESSSVLYRFIENLNDFQRQLLAALGPPYLARYENS